MFIENDLGMVTRSKKRKLNDIAGGAPEEWGPLTKRKKITEFRLMKFLETEIHHGYLNERKKGQEDQGPGNPFQEVEEQKVAWTNCEERTLLRIAGLSDLPSLWQY